MTTQQSTSSGSGSSASRTRDELKDDAGRLKETAGRRASEEAETRKGQTARAAHSVSSALGTAAGELEQDQDAPSWLSSAARQAAGGIDRFASELEGRSIGEIGQQVSNLARSNPAAFLAASAAAGFAAARVLRAGAEHRHHSEASGEFRGQEGGPEAGQGSAEYGGIDAYVRRSEGAEL